MPGNELVALRLLIANRAPADRVTELSTRIVQQLDQSHGPFRDLMTDSLHMSDQLVRQGRWDEALHEIQLVHNLPGSAGELETWDEAHFFEVELVSYLEWQHDLQRIKRVLSLVGEQAAKT